MKRSKIPLVRRIFTARETSGQLTAAIGREVKQARALHNRRYRYDTPGPGRSCIACAICGQFFWAYRPVFTCSTACARTYSRTTMLRLHAKQNGERYRHVQNYKIWNRRGLAPPRVALHWRNLALRRGRARRRRRKRDILKRLIATRTITAQQLAYLRENDFDILVTAIKAMSSIFTREQTERLRAQAASIVAKNLERAGAFLAGESDPLAKNPTPVGWGPQHVALFGRLLNKVVPDLSQSHVHTTTEAVSPDTLTFEQLAAIASGANTTINLTPSKVITHDPQQRSAPDPVDRDVPGPREGD